MDNFPPRTPEQKPHQARVFMAHYFGAYAFSMLGFVIALLFAVGGLFLTIRYDILNPLAGLLLGALVGAVIFNFLIGLVIRAKAAELDEFHREKARIREAETQRKIAEMKAKEALK